jgi:16S rRNA processing protein RimM
MTGPDAADTVEVGRINGVWGVQGWVKIYSYTDPPAAIFDYQPWSMGEGGREVRIQQWRQQGARLVACIEGLETPEQAARLIDEPIVVSRQALPRPRPGRFYWHDLVGLNVVNLQGHEYGRVQRLFATGANDVIEVRQESGNTVLIPFVYEHFVKSVDLDDGLITVDWPIEWLEE